MGVVLLGNHQCPKIQREGLGEGEKTLLSPGVCPLSFFWLFIKR